MQQFDPFIRTVLNMMTRFGGDFIMSAPDVSSYDVSTSTATVTPVQHTVRAIIMDYVPKLEGVGNGSLIQSGDKQVFMKPDDAIPAPDPLINTLLINGVKYRIVTIKELNPSGTKVVLYEMYVRT